MGTQRNYPNPIVVLEEDLHMTTIEYLVFRGVVLCSMKVICKV